MDQEQEYRKRRSEAGSNVTQPIQPRVEDNRPTREYRHDNGLEELDEANVIHKSFSS